MITDTSICSPVSKIEHIQIYSYYIPFELQGKQEYKHCKPVFSPCFLKINDKF